MQTSEAEVASPQEVDLACKAVDSSSVSEKLRELVEGLKEYRTVAIKQENPKHGGRICRCLRNYIKGCLQLLVVY